MAGTKERTFFLRESIDIVSANLRRAIGPEWRTRGRM
jgi:hypothetical protein